jgi:glycerol kinase
MAGLVLALDQGTTSSRSILFSEDGRIVASAQQEFRQHYPQGGWVEHEPEDIWQSQLATARKAIRLADVEAADIACIGIANQRETVVLWERKTGHPIGRAIVWQCRRTATTCAALREQGHEPLVQEKTGLLLDPYFSATKIAWLLDSVPGLRQRAEAGEICFGTVDSWLIHRLTGAHLTDPSNASRTLLFNLHTGAWDDELLDLFRVPRAILPEIRPTSGILAQTKPEWFGNAIPVAGVAGDQQAALFGQACFAPGEAKNTYGTGAFALVNTGRRPILSANRLLSTVAWDIGDGLCYALEGAVFVAGAVVQWLRDGMGLIAYAAETEAICRTVDDTGGVVFVPAFVGLGAPHWDPQVRGSLLGLTRGTGRAHVIRAALESIAYQCHDLLQAIEKDTGTRMPSLKVDGGASANGFLMQFQADLLGIPVVRSAIPETTALGAAYLAGLAVGVWGSTTEIRSLWSEKDRFQPTMTPPARTALLAQWHRALNAARQF